uniref:Amidohydrolase-related domain-containing protein n=1 Tax=Eutreptiella gymnastica TaxID=73025 RepID=A0A7S4LLM3_9EUGL
MYTHDLDVDAASAGLKVKKAVFVEVSACDSHLVQEAQWVQDTYVNDPKSRLVAMTVSAPVEQGAAATARALDALQGCAVKGVRRLIQGREAGFARSDAFVQGVQEVARRRLPFELCIRAGARPEQCDDVLELVRRVPEGVFILDHVGKPNVAGKEFEEWAKFITALAQFPNCYCKISGLVTEAAAAWSVDDLRPYVLHALGQFGYNRCMYGSDWFVCTLASSILRWMAALCDIVDSASADEKQALFSATACKVYSLAS